MPAFDTTFFLDRLGRGGKRARDRVEAFALALPPQAGFLTTRFTVAELLAGVEGASDPISERRRIGDLLDGITVLDFDEAATLSYAKIYAHRSEEHTSELQSRFDLVCRLLLEKKK